MEAQNHRNKSSTKSLRFKDERYVAGKNWKSWLEELKKSGADKMKHKEIAALLEKQFKISQWWAQSIALRFEQEIERRIPGETSENTFQANVSLTMNGDAEEIFSKWTEDFSFQAALNGIKLKSDATTSVTKKWYYWRAKLTNGSAISINFSQKNK
jgi:phosphatidylinositol kinase/protein kinase (PI-3  family)